MGSISVEEGRNSLVEECWGTYSSRDIDTGANIVADYRVEEYTSVV
jgi:hypothetical protein